MENETTTQNCRNCGHPLPEGANYCPQCSQKNHDGRLSFREMAVEMVSTIFNLDNKIFRSFLALLVPGKLTVDYFEGKHVRYYHPLRLFLFTVWRSSPSPPCATSRAGPTSRWKKWPTT